MVARQDCTMENEPVPEADALEQKRDVADADAGDDRIDSVGDRPEADALDQRRPVTEERTVRPPAERGEVPEADWIEQQVTEPLDDEVR